MNYADMERAKRCQVGNKFFLAAKSERLEVTRHSRSLLSAIEHSRFRFIPINQKMLDSAKEEVKNLISQFEAHVSECDRCVVTDKVLETV